MQLQYFYTEREEMIRQFIGLCLSALCISATAQTDAHNFKIAKNIDIFNRVYRNLDMMYVDTLDADKVIGRGITYMMQGLDPYTEYYPAEKLNSLKMMLTGKYAGIGAQIKFNFQLDRVVIDEPLEGMPAAEAGLRKGDIILSVNNEDMNHKTTEYVSSKLRGDAGTTFALKIKRPSTGKQMQMKITRRTIQNPPVPYYGLQNDGIGYIALTGFTEGCGKIFRNAVIEMKRQGMKGLVVDLRGNGGGSELEAVNVVNTFLPQGKLVVTNKGRVDANNHDYRTTVEPVDSVMPVVVLVNGNTASASEITAGALQDYDRALIVGTKTYGKGIVQTVIDLPYNAQMKLTTNKYYIPSGRCIQKINYKHDDDNNSEEMPDSLRKVFYTANGRPVKDGGGIMPDVEIKPDSIANIVYYLTNVRDSDELVHNFEVNYIAKHNNIGPASDFRLTENDFNDFKKMVLNSRFKYDAMSEKALDNLEKLTQFEGYYDDAKAEFAALRTKLKHNLNKDLEFNKKEICEMLEADIVAAYYFQKGAIQNSIARDKQTKEAIRLLLHPDEYNKLLQPVSPKASTQK